MSWITDNRGLPPWAFSEAARKTSYNEGHKIATASSPVWDATQSSVLRNPVTPVHTPCGYWGKGLYNTRQRIWYIYGIRWRGLVLYIGPSGDYTSITAALTATTGVDVLLVLEKGTHSAIEAHSAGTNRAIFVKGDTHEPTDVVISGAAAVYDLWVSTNLYIEGVTLSCASVYSGAVIRETALSSTVTLNKCIVNFPNITKYGGFLVQQYDNPCYVSIRLRCCTINSGRFLFGGNDSIHKLNLSTSRIEHCQTNTVATRYTKGSLDINDYVLTETSGYGYDVGAHIITSSNIYE